MPTVCNGIVSMKVSEWEEVKSNIKALEDAGDAMAEQLRPFYTQRIDESSPTVVEWEEVRNWRKVRGRK